MSDKTLPRPPQATFLGGAIIVSSVLVLLLAFDRTASLGSIEAQEEAQRFADAQGSWTGLTADGWQTVLRVLCLVAGALSVVTGFLGWRVLQRDRGARLALSVLAPVVLVAGYAVTAFVPAVTTVAVVLLWRSPTREWFDGKTAPPRPQAPSRQERAEVPGPSAAAGPPEPTSGAAPPAYPPPPTYGAPQPYAAPPHPYAAHPHAPGHAGPGAARPGTVTSAAVVTIVTSTIVLLGLGAVLLFVLGDRAGFEREVATELASQEAYGDVEPSSVTGVVIGAMVLFLVWSVAAIVLAVLTLRGSNGARIALAVSAIGAAVVSLLGVLAVVPLLVTAAAIAVAVLLLRRDAATWFATRRRT